MARFGRMVVVLLVLLVLAGDAKAVTLVTPDGEIAQPYQRWVDRAKVPTAPGTILVTRGTCAPGATGCYPNGVRREIGVTDKLGRLGLLHELGHDFDFRAGTEGMRGAFMWLIGLSPWWNGDWHPEKGPASPGEQFADAYAVCALGLRASPWPEYRARRSACALIRRTAGWYMRPTSASESAESADTGRSPRR